MKFIKRYSIYLYAFQLFLILSVSISMTYLAFTRLNFGLSSFMVGLLAFGLLFAFLQSSVFGNANVCMFTEDKKYCLTIDREDLNSLSEEIARSCNVSNMAIEYASLLKDVREIIQHIHSVDDYEKLLSNTKYFVSTVNYNTYNKYTEKLKELESQKDLCFRLLNEEDNMLTTFYEKYKKYVEVSKDLLESGDVLCEVFPFMKSPLTVLRNRNIELNVIFKMDDKALLRSKINDIEREMLDIHDTLNAKADELRTDSLYLTAMKDRIKDYSKDELNHIVL